MKKLSLVLLALLPVGIEAPLREGVRRLGGGKRIILAAGAADEEKLPDAYEVYDFGKLSDAAEGEILNEAGKRLLASKR